MRWEGKGLAAQWERGEARGSGGNPSRFPLACLRLVPLACLPLPSSVAPPPARTGRPAPDPEGRWVRGGAVEGGWWRLGLRGRRRERERRGEEAMANVL